MREVLHQNESLKITLVVDESGEEVTVEIESLSGGPDLSVDDEVVVAVDGHVCPLEVKSSSFAVATLEEPEGQQEGAEEGDSAVLMVRVHEFFEGWELF